MLVIVYGANVISKLGDYKKLKSTLQNLKSFHKNYFQDTRGKRSAEAPKTQTFSVEACPRQALGPLPPPPTPPPPTHNNKLLTINGHMLVNNLYTKMAPHPKLG
jgi:hypothetical protein